MSLQGSLRAQLVRQRSAVALMMTATVEGTERVALARVLFRKTLTVAETSKRSRPEKRGLRAWCQRCSRGGREVVLFNGLGSSWP